MEQRFSFIDLFCGIGGFHQAMTSLGGQCLFACDIDKDCRKTYYKNYGLLPKGDITALDAGDIPAHDVLCAGFPCQSFSKAGKRQGFHDETKGILFFDIMRIVRHHKPRYLLLENVRNLASHDTGNTWRIIRECIDAVGYDVLPQPVIFSPHYIGIPQHRERVFIMCVRKDVGGTLPAFHCDETHLPSCSIDTILLDDSEIDNLDEYKLGEDYISLIEHWNTFVKGLKTELPGFPVWADRLCPLNTDEDLSQYPDWCENFIRKNNALYEQNKAFLTAWRAEAEQNKLFRGAKAKLEWQAGKTNHPDIWDTIMQFRPSGLRVKAATYFPALVAITQTSIVGKRRRYLTPRECARLQSFPDTFLCDEKPAQAYKQFGNAVNVECARLMALFLFGDSTVRATYARQQRAPLPLFAAYNRK